MTPKPDPFDKIDSKILRDERPEMVRIPEEDIIQVLQLLDGAKRKLKKILERRTIP